LISILKGLRNYNVKGIEMYDIRKATFGRLPIYLKYLTSLDDSVVYVSSSQIAKALGLGDVQVKKDLGSISGKGKPKIGYEKAVLIEDLKQFITKNHQTKVVLVGVGKLGNALLDYDGFRKFGLSIATAFDSDPNKIGKSEQNKSILPVDELGRYCKENGVEIGIIAVPAKFAQSVCDVLIENGVKAIWNFAPVKLAIPENVILKQEDLSLSLAYLNLQI
jgi:redox-sensing transcriptional repressor